MFKSRIRKTVINNSLNKRTNLTLHSRCWLDFNSQDLSFQLPANWQPANRSGCNMSCHMFGFCGQVMEHDWKVTAVCNVDSWIN